MTECYKCKYYDASTNACESGGFCQANVDEIQEQAYQQGREDALNEAIVKANEYASVWMEYTDGMTKEQIAHEALKSAKQAMVRILEQMKEQKNENSND